MDHKTRVLFICTGNSARSQMAEALLRGLAGDRFEVYSAGLEPKPIHPMVYQAMAEWGYDLAGQEPKDIRRFLGQMHFGYLITVCDRAARNCPFFPGISQRLDWSIEDPSAYEGSDAERLDKFREVRNSLLARIEAFIRQTG